MRSEYDVVVVGGGPAGATAALAVARRGCSVLVIEASDLPREKLCGGLLSRKTVRIVNRLHGTTDEDLVRLGIINYSSNGYRIVFDSKPLCDDVYDYPFHFVERAVLDAWLLDRAVEAGADLLTGVPVRDVNLATGAVVLRDGRMVRGRRIIGADGANSVVRRSFPVDKRAWTKSLASTVEVRIPRAQYPKDVAVPEVHIGPIAEGYGWVFPNSDHVVVGLGGRMPGGGNIAALFRVFCHELGIHDTDSLQLKGHPLPFGNYLPRLVHGKGVLAGDAGGLVEPVFGEGIYFAIRSGEAAGESICRSLKRHRSPEAEYMRELRRDVYGEILGSRRMQRVLYFFDRNGLNPLVKWGVRVGREVLLDVIHGRRSFRLFRKLPDNLRA
ncbi:NAD(P)/FAD-dependent oxidoreductase [Desulfovibrio subterraneus]|uniref:Geranylgeranyl reductase n=1 Tax=Desulfovibrio subterraneus TaxID=2718620 RepID=A0A7J0BIE9_9BACT|nr:NAD(P)/FAD-dependent oxidoreductase [Desulfovibrio subterraneus]GFM33429.1 geranylgeranyl reductase [Desulfovibrio subterraneus]